MAAHAQTSIMLLVLFMDALVWMVIRDTIVKYVRSIEPDFEKITLNKIKNFFFKTIKAPCDSNLCENGASCENFDNNTHPYYGCICINGYEGATCQTCKLDNNNLNPRSLNTTFSYLVNY